MLNFMNIVKAKNNLNILVQFLSFVGLKAMQVFCKPRCINLAMDG